MIHMIQNNLIVVTHPPACFVEKEHRCPQQKKQLTTLVISASKSRKQDEGLLPHSHVFAAAQDRVEANKIWLDLLFAAHGKLSPLVWPQTWIHGRTCVVPWLYRYLML